MCCSNHDDEQQPLIHYYFIAVESIMYSATSTVMSGAAVQLVQGNPSLDFSPFCPARRWPMSVTIAGGGCSGPSVVANWSIPRSALWSTVDQS